MKSTFSLVKLPSSIDLVLFLIKEELKSQRFFNGLRKVGIEDCWYETNLGKLILATIGLDDGRDETFDFYYTLIEKRSKKIKPDNESLTKQAFKVYVALMAEKRRR